MARKGQTISMNRILAVLLSIGIFLAIGLVLVIGSVAIQIINDCGNCT
jgi:hypothetical protein